MRGLCTILLVCVIYSAFAQASDRSKRQVTIGFGGFPSSGQATPNPNNILGGIIGGIFGQPQPANGQNGNQNPGGLFGQPAGGGGFDLTGIFGRPNGCRNNNGGCQQGCRMVRRRRQCYCFDGYHLNNADGSCTDIDECFEFSPCGGKCLNNEGSYVCSCPRGSTLQADGGCFSEYGNSPDYTDQTSCSSSNGGCEQSCRESNFGVECGCQKGYELSVDDQKSCLDLDECASGTNSCGETPCVNTVGSYTCSAPTQSCQQNNGGCAQRCQDTRNGPKCRCRNTFVLQADGKSCGCPPGRRQQGQRCTGGNGGRPVLSQNSNQGTCEDPPNGGCEHNCRVNRRGIKRCVCRRNFLLRDDGVGCECPAGFKLNRNGRQCREDVGGPAPIAESCDVNNGGCEHKCIIRNNGKLVCRCNRNFELAADKKSCTSTAVDPCAVDNGRCDHVCSDNNGRPACSCNAGFQLINGNTCLEAQPQETTKRPATVATTPRPKPTPRPTQQGCGTNNKKSLLRRIVGGKPADPKDWPWMAAILRKGSNDQFCGGVLITDRHILTAAHCLVDFPKTEVTVRLGEYDFDRVDDNSPTDFAVVDIKLHESYNRSSQENDIAIMKLDRPSSFSEFIWPVCLPPADGNFDDQLGYVTGWGTTSFGGKVSRVLQEVIVPVWAQPECSSAYPDKITKSMMCAGERAGGKDSCQGDSGGPFLVQIYPSTRWFVIGVVSWGIKCAEAGNPGVYTRVNNYLPWIQSNAVF